MIWVDEPSANGPLKIYYLIGVAIYTLLIWSLLVVAVRHNNTPGVVLAMWLSSIIPMGLIATLIEGRSYGEIYSLRNQSWMFLLGDSIFLPLAGVVFSRVWNRQTHSGWGYQWWWVVVCLLIGLGFGLIFHDHDQKVYTALAFNSPTKLYHDLAAYTLLAGGLVYTGVPALITTIKFGDHAGLVWAILAVIIGIGGWAASGVPHHEFTGGLNVARLHPQWSWQHPVGVVTPVSSHQPSS